MDIKLTNKKEEPEFSWNDEIRKINDEISGSAEEEAPDMEWVEELKDMNKDLEERIQAANEDKTKVKWSKLLPDLMGADILMIGQFSGPEDGSGNRQLNIMMLQKNGHAIVPFFTSPDKIGKLANPARMQFDVMKVNTVRFFQSIQGKACVLNPMTEQSRIFTPFETKILAAENIDKAPELPVQE